MGNGQRESGPFIEGGGDDNGTEGQKKSVEARDKRNIARKKKESGRKLQSHEIRRTARMVRREVEAAHHWRPRNSFPLQPIRIPGTLSVGRGNIYSNVLLSTSAASDIAVFFTQN